MSTSQVSRALERERRLLAGVCTYSGCTELAVEGFPYCTPHLIHERARDAAKKQRRRSRRVQARQCRDCGQPSPHVRCMSCREVHRAACRVVPGSSSVVPGKWEISSLVSAIRPGRDRTLLVTLELPLALLLHITESGERTAACGHRLCSRDDGRAFCVYQAIRAARQLRQLDGRVPDERGDRNGVEYALTVEQIAQLVGVSTRSIEQSLKKALERLRDTPHAEALMRAVLGD